MMHPFFPGAVPFMQPMLGVFFLPLAIALAAWVVGIKGYALWCAARNNHKAWYVVLLIVNTLGILEIVYLVWFRNKNGLGAAQPVSPATAPSSEERAS